MSAYDWKNCPICQNKKRILQERLQKERKTLSDNKYKELLEELDNLKSSEEENGDTPVRQDQEIWLTEEGKLKGYISMGCQSCGASWEHRFEVDYKNGEED